LENGLKGCPLHFHVFHIIFRGYIITYAVPPIQVRIDAAGKEHKMHETYGYVRVSTKEQNEDRQRIAMREANVPEKNIFMDKQSGKDFDRPQYKKLVKSCAEMICSTSRVLTAWDVITKRSRTSGASSRKRNALTSLC